MAFDSVICFRGRRGVASDEVERARPVLGSVVSCHSPQVLFSTVSVSEATT